MKFQYTKKVSVGLEEEVEALASSLTTFCYIVPPNTMDAGQPSHLMKRETEGQRGKIDQSHSASQWQSWSLHSAQGPVLG